MLAQAESHERTRPSYSLVIELVPFGRHVGHADGILHEFHLVARLSDFLRQVAVESRTDVPVSHLLERLRLESTEGSRNDMVDAQFAGHDASHLYSLQVFKGLQRRADGSLVVSHLYASSHGFHLSIQIEWDEHFLQGVAVERGVGIEAHDVFAPCHEGSVVAGCRLSATGFQSQIVRNEFRTIQVGAYQFGVVVATVVHHDDFVVSVGLLVQRLHHLIDVLAFVLSRHQDADEGILSVEIELGNLIFLFSFVPVHQSPEDHQVFQDVVSRHLDVEEKPVGVYDARQRECRYPVPEVV